MKTLRITFMAIFAIFVLSSCAETSASNEYSYATVAALQSKIACLEGAINSAQSSIDAAAYALSDIENEFYWINETQAWYPEDMYELEELVDEADEAFVAIDNARLHINTLSTSIDEIESALSYWC